MNETGPFFGVKDAQLLSRLDPVALASATGGGGGRFGVLELLELLHSQVGHVGALLAGEVVVSHVLGRLVQAGQPDGKVNSPAGTISRAHAGAVQAADPNLPDADGDVAPLSPSSHVGRRGLKEFNLLAQDALIFG